MKFQTRISVADALVSGIVEIRKRNDPLSPKLYEMKLALQKSSKVFPSAKNMIFPATNRKLQKFMPSVESTSKKLGRQPYVKLQTGSYSHSRIAIGANCYTSPICNF